MGRTIVRPILLLGQRSRSGDHSANLQDVFSADSGKDVIILLAVQGGIICSTPATRWIQKRKFNSFTSQGGF
jgi:hypothetical protein